MEITPRDPTASQRRTDPRLKPWAVGRSVLVPNRDNPGQIVWKGCCSKCRQDRFLVRFERRRRSANAYRRVMQVCGCPSPGGLTVQDASGAVALLRSWDAEYERRAGPRSVANFIETVWLPERRASPHVAGSTFATDRRRARCILRDAAFAAMPVADVTGEHCQALLDRLHHASLSEYTIRGVAGVLKTVLYAAVRRGWMARNPVGAGGYRLRIPVPVGRRGVAAAARRTKRYWRPEQVHAYLALAPTFEPLPGTYVIFAITIVLGLRPGEACALTWSDFEADCTRLRVWKSIAETHERDRVEGETAGYEESLTKERSINVVPVPEVLAEILRRYRHEQNSGESDHLVVNRHGEPLTPRSLYARWRDWGTRADGTRFEKGFFVKAREAVQKSFGGEVDLHYITPYGHRHSCAVYILQFADAIDAAKALRHARSTGTSLITMHYGEILEGRELNRVVRMDELVRAGVSDLPTPARPDSGTTRTSTPDSSQDDARRDA